MYVETMDEELRALKLNNTWDLVSRIPHMNYVGSNGYKKQRQSLMYPLNVLSLD